MGRGFTPCLASLRTTESQTRDGLKAELSAPLRAALDDYLRRRSTVLPVRGDFSIQHDIVRVSQLLDTDLAKLFDNGGLVLFSPVGFDSRGEAAFLHVQHRCSFSECATGSFVSLSRAFGERVIEKNLPGWIE